MSGDTNPIGGLLTQIKVLFILVLIGVVVFFAGYYISYKKASESYELLLTEKTALVSGLKIAKTKSTTLKKQLEGAGKNVKELKQIIRSMEEAPPKVEYIVRTKTVVEKSEPTIKRIIKKCDVPKPYDYKLKNGLKVAKFRTSSDGDKVSIEHDTATLTLKSTLVSGKNKTAYLLKAISSLEPDKEYVLPVQHIEAKKLRQFKLFEPHLMLGLDLSFYNDASVIVSGSLSMPMIHIMDRRLDLLGPKLNFSEKDLSFGLNFANYNLGYHLPVLTDLWIGAGMSVSLSRGSLSGDISLGSKF